MSQLIYSNLSSQLTVRQFSGKTFKSAPDQLLVQEVDDEKYYICVLFIFSILRSSCRSCAKVKVKTQRYLAC